jgi:hypothetical protein
MSAGSTAPKTEAMMFASESLISIRMFTLARRSASDRKATFDARFGH